ncbi:MAG: PKD repeat protein/subtilisin family serine protease [Candidatus Krumholzibacteriia bacterium]|jgi:PKD repeat protein/subtilisin family serine protease
MRKSLALLLIISLSLMGGISQAADDATRTYVPVQGGFVGSAPQAQHEVKQWATDHLLVQLTVPAYEKANLPNPGNKSVSARTGLASLDQVFQALDVASLRIAYPRVTNKSMASDLGANRWLILDVTEGSDIEDMVSRLEADPNIAVAQPDLYAYPTAVPNDGLYASNWGHNNTGQLPGYNWFGGGGHNLSGVGTVGFDTSAQSAWSGAQGYGSSSVIIAILDSGVDVGHPDLLQVTGFDYGDNDSNPDDDSAQPGHGTACAGVAAAIANNALGAAGIAGGCSIMPLKVSNSAGSLLFSAIDNAIYHAADNGADIISMSFGAATTFVPATDAAINYAYLAGVTLLAATGNENASVIGYPAINTRVIGVGSASPCGERKRSSSDAGEVNPGVTVDPNGFTCDGERWWGSNYGSSTQDNMGAVDIIAPTILPTTDIQGAGGYDGGDYSSFFNGTSCSTPYAAGVCALILSANPTFTPSQVRTQLVGSAQDIVGVESGVGWDRYTGYGMVDAAAAVGAVIIPDVVADFTADNTEICTGTTVQFTDASTGDPETWIWNFGEGSPSANQNPSHTYNIPGVYTVTLAVTAPEGDADVAKIDYITVTGPPVVSFTPSSLTFITAGDNVIFTDTTTGDPTSWVWDFGDGGSSAVQNPTYMFNTPGLYHVKLKAFNTCGPDSLTINNLIVVGVPALPTAAFSFTPDTGCTDLEVTFTDESTGSPTGWAWDFGDGNNANVASPVHSYTTGGSFDVTLIVTNAGGADTLSIADAVVVTAGPAAAFSVSDSTGVAPLNVTFTDNSTGTPTAWAWDFGDGGSSSVANPVHSFMTEDSFDVRLIVSNACGSDTLTTVAAVVVDGVSGVESNTPVPFGISQSYPNPFNPSTTIVFGLEKPGFAQLDVYDVSGKRITTLVSEQKSAGQYEVTWRPADLSSGVYFSRLTVGGQTDTKRMTLLK